MVLGEREMKVHFVTTKEQGIDFFPELIALLQAEFPEMVPETYFVPTPLDIPLQAKQCADKADLVVVSFLHDKENKRVEFILRKLVEIELETGTKIIKAFDESEVGIKPMILSSQPPFSISTSSKEIGLSNLSKLVFLSHCI